MSKKLRKKIYQLCNIDQLPHGEKIHKAKKILQNNDFKQQLCHKAPGLTFRDINKTMRALVATSKTYKKRNPQKSEDEPEKKVTMPIRRKTAIKYRDLTPAECTRLVRAMDEVTVNQPLCKSVESRVTYPTYSKEEVAAIMANDRDLKSNIKSNIKTKKP